MTSLLFQAQKGGASSSSSSSSSSSNPFLALSNFYEQELTDLQIDARLSDTTRGSSSSSSSSSSRLYRQQHKTLPSSSVPHQTTRTRRQHLFPSSPASSSSSSSSPSLQSTAPSKYTHQDTSSHYTQAEDEFHTFSQGLPLHTLVQPSVHVAASADIAEHLKQREDYYAREARLRSQDRNDGLGPILDFSEESGRTETAAAGVTPRGLEDHLASRHFNPYADSPVRMDRQQERLQHRSLEKRRGSRASSQQEQVWMDHGLLNQVQSDKLDEAWHEAATNARLAANSSAAAIAGGSLASTFKDAAASLPSSWPLAPWAIETEAALMEFETIYKDYGPTPLSRQIYASPQITTTPMSFTQEESLKQATNWTEEFSRMESNTAADVTANDKSLLKERRGSIKTCGYMLDAKRRSVSFGMEELDPLTLVSSFSDLTSITSPSQDASNRPMETVHVATAGQGVQLTATPMSDSSWNNLPKLESRMEPNLTRKDAEVCNDDVFEGDMLQAWMDTLAQEKQEADERSKEEKEKLRLEKEEEEAQAQEDASVTGADVTVQDRLVLEVALRRLNALMHQLDRRQGQSSDEKRATDHQNATSTVRLH
ncbi:hypothetical protein BGZ72_006993 [Mortierella alpina]|nr:hypothetical protein BGZ72_006993 [Mortierella alpina]